MGPSAVLRVGAIQVLVTTYATYDWADEQFRAVDLIPLDAKFIVVKNPMNYRPAYGGNAKAAYILDTPGPTPATFRHVRYKRLPSTFPGRQGRGILPDHLVVAVQNADRPPDARMRRSGCSRHTIREDTRRAVCPSSSLRGAA